MQRGERLRVKEMEGKGEKEKNMLSRMDAVQRKCSRLMEKKGK